MESYFLYRTGHVIILRKMKDSSVRDDPDATEGGVIITTPQDPHTAENKDNIYLFPNMLDQYQISLTRMLEAEQYGEAKRLLQFLLQCQGQDQRLYEEWETLLGWLEMAFPGEGGGAGEPDDDGADEDRLREQLLQPSQQDDAYVRQVIHIMQRHPMIDQQMLALERAVHLRADYIDREIVDWLEREDVHPLVQFKALQTLRKRGASGAVSMNRMGEAVRLNIEETPLSMDGFPRQVTDILERTEEAAEADDPTLPHFARELWKESLQFLYGTSSYQWMLREDEGTVDCFAAALYVTLQLTVYGSANDDDIREAFGITDGLRFRYEQACRMLRSVSMMLQSGEDEPEP